MEDNEVMRDCIQRGSMVGEDLKVLRNKNKSSMLHGFVNK